MTQRRLTIHEIPNIPEATRVLLTGIVESAWRSIILLSPATPGLKLKVDEKEVRLVFSLPFTPLRPTWEILKQIDGTLARDWAKEIREALKELGFNLFRNKFPKLPSGTELHFKSNWPRPAWDWPNVEILAEVYQKHPFFLQRKVKHFILRYVERTLGLPTPKAEDVWYPERPIERLLKEKFPDFSLKYPQALRGMFEESEPVLSSFKTKEDLDRHIRFDMLHFPTADIFWWIEKAKIREWVEAKNELIRKGLIDENYRPKVPLQSIGKMLQRMLHPPLTCPVCKKRLIQRKKDQKTCGKAKCRQKLYRERKKQKEGKKKK